ncbi:MAG: YicC family protein [Gammaproteobacteria bacterium]|nr:YicC family protein [Gammaproteobacteria bacterium]
MIRSMTGFAQSETGTPQGVLLWELRSVNNRYLEVQLRLPELFRPIENDVRQLAAARLGRGRVEAGLSLRNAQGLPAASRLNLVLARQIIAHAQTLADELDNPAALNALELLRWPGVLEQEEQDLSALLPLALAGFETALADLDAARGREGARIEEMFERRLTEIEGSVATVVGRLPTVLARIRERLAERIASLGIQTDSERLEQEIALLAQKLDVSEELDRLTAHIAEFRSNLRAGIPVGRRLDFLVQELNREANTLGSKSADAETTRLAVDIKVLIEQIREQVQNVE